MPPLPIRASRSLLFPGPQPPLTHLGATLMRHLVGAGLRYSFYQLGLEPPESPPVRIHRLRLHLDTAGLERLLRSHPAADELVAALVDPGGAATTALPPRLGATAAFHRARLKIQRHPILGRLPGNRSRNDASYEEFRGAIGRWVAILGDALLAEVLATLDRRQKRRRGQPLTLAMSREAARFLTRSKPRLSFLGSPDPISDSWAIGGVPASVHRDTSAVSGDAVPHPVRGRFREHYRRCLDVLRPLYLSLADRAVERRLIDDREDAFFIPLDLAADLAADSRPSWLEPAVAANRLEHETELDRPPAPEVLRAGEPGAQELVGLGGRPPDWALAPLVPLA